MPRLPAQEANLNQKRLLRVVSPVRRRFLWLDRSESPAAVPRRGRGEAAAAGWRCRGCWWPTGWWRRWWWCRSCAGSGPSSRAPSPRASTTSSPSALTTTSCTFLAPPSFPSLRSCPCLASEGVVRARAGGSCSRCAAKGPGISSSASSSTTATGQTRSCRYVLTSFSTWTASDRGESVLHGQWWGRIVHDEMACSKEF